MSGPSEIAGDRLRTIVERIADGIGQRLIAIAQKSERSTDLTGLAVSQGGTSGIAPVVVFSVPCGTSLDEFDVPCR